MFHGAVSDTAKEIVIDGPHRGDLCADSVRIAQGGSVFGNIVARVVRVSGRLEGDVDSKEFYAGPTARIRGVIRHEKIGLQPGVSFSARAEKVPFNPSANAVKPADRGQVELAATPAFSSPDLPFRSGQKGPVWVGVEKGTVLTDERRAMMMENIRAALADVAAGLPPLAKPIAEKGFEPASAQMPAKRVLPSLLGEPGK